jgi:peptidyl-prolyl cis-trans isomerase D
VIDRTVAEAAFAPKDAGAPDPGAFWPCPGSRAQIEPGAGAPFQEVAGELKQELAAARQGRMLKIYDKIEDTRPGKTPAEAAENLKLPCAPSRRSTARDATRAGCRSSFRISRSAGSGIHCRSASM